jgi:hypothetical protein
VERERFVFGRAAVVIGGMGVGEQAREGRAHQDRGEAHERPGEYDSQESPLIEPADQL